MSTMGFNRFFCNADPVEFKNDITFAHKGRGFSARTPILDLGPHFTEMDWL